MDIKFSINILKRLYALVIITVLVCLASCDEADPNFDLQNGNNLELFDYYVDEYGNEGVVFYVQEMSKWYHTASYKIVISLDEGYESWGPLDRLIYKEDSLTYNDICRDEYGVAMHQLMHHIGIEKFPAQAWCHKKNIDEKYPWAGSWRLPTLFEWEKVSMYYTKLNAALIKYGGIPMDESQMYWTCMEDYNQVITIKGETNNTFDPANKAISLTPGYKVINGKNDWIKSYEHNVRAIKYIYYQAKD